MLLTLDENQTVPVTIRQHVRAKRLILRIDPRTRGVIVTKPRRVSLRQAQQFVEERKLWIMHQLSRLPDTISVDALDTIIILGQRYQIERVTSGGVVWMEGDRLFVNGQPDQVAGRIRRFLRQHAKEVLAVRAAHYADRLGVSYEKIVVKDTTSRWGSCSHSGTLSFSWRLIMAPSAVLDYVVAHEVAHLIEMNHSAAFWKLVAGVCPDYRHAKAWLKQNGETLFLF